MSEARDVTIAGFSLSNPIRPANLSPMTLSSTESDQSHQRVRDEATRVTLIGMLLDIVLGVAKIAGGALTSSFALIADGIHSLTDAATDVFVLVVARVAYAAPDRGHPYGHGRFEAVGTNVMGIVFFCTAGILVYDAFLRLNALEDLVKPALSGALIAALSIAGKEWIYRYTLAVAEKLNSSLLRANAWHSRSDAFSSIAVLIGIVGAQAGIVWLDTLAAVVVAILIAKIGWELFSESLSELVDGALPDERRASLEQCLRQTPGVLGLTDLRSRLSGGRAIIEVHLVVSPRISVSEGHHIGALAAQRLRQAFSDIAEVIPHIDPQGNPDHDLPHSKTQLIPTRRQISERIETQWRTLSSTDADTTALAFDLHYLDAGIEIDLVITQDDQQQRAQRLAESLSDESAVVCVRVLKRLSEITPPHAD